MTDTPVILGASRERGSVFSPKPEVGWSLLRIFGLAFIVAGGIDLALLWYPSRMGTPEFEFATISSFVAGLPVLTTGLIATGVWAAVTGRKGWMITVAIVAILMVVALAIFAVIFATTVPLALRVSELAVKTGSKKAIVRSGVQFISYGLTYLALGWTLIKASRR